MAQNEDEPRPEQNQPTVAIDPNTNSLINIPWRQVLSNIVGFQTKDLRKRMKDLNDHRAREETEDSERRRHSFGSSRAPTGPPGMNNIDLDNLEGQEYPMDNWSACPNPSDPLQASAFQGDCNDNKRCPLPARIDSITNMEQSDESEVYTLAPEPEDPVGIFDQLFGDFGIPEVAGVLGGIWLLIVFLYFLVLLFTGGPPSPGNNFLPPNGKNRPDTEDCYPII